MADDIPNSTYIWTKDGVVLPETDFDLIVSETGFYEVDIVSTAGDCGSLEGSAQVDFFDVPVANVPSNLPACDDDNDGFWLFDLSQQNPDILLAQDPMQFEVEYYASLADATNGQSQISGNYQNTSNPQIIYARVENVDYRRCVDIVPFEIQVYNTPEIINTMPLNACDEDSNAMDGQTSINLLDFNTEILGTQNPALYTITYHSTSNDAMTNTSALPDNYTNATPFTETIYVRIENNNNTDCFATGDFIVNINPIPEAFNSNLYQCDEIGIVDGLTLFNLTEANEALTGNTPDRSTQFYPSLIDAQNDTSELNATSYTNISNPQTVYVKVTNDITGCVNYSELVLEASNTQISDYVAPAVCDELNSEDGINTFNLDDFSTVILTGLPAGLDIAYYETSSDALLEQNPLNSIYNNSTPYSQTIYVRVENANACYGINEVLLTINPLPELESDETILYCLNDFPTTITISGNVINGGTNSFNYAWSNGANTPAIDINATGTYTVTVTNNTTGCSKTRTVTVEPSNIATIENIEITDGSLGNNQITVITSGEGEYEYALVNQDGDSTVYQESNVFSQIPPGIYTVMVRDIKNNCGIVNDMLSVIGFPLYFTPNGDTVNDTWQVYGVSEEFQSKSEIIIYDRYGKLITQIKASSKGWDGTYNGVPLPTSDYWFSVILEDGRVYKNHFTLKR